MSWADLHIKRLQAGETVSFRPKGHSMHPKVKSGQLVTLIPSWHDTLNENDIVLCRVKGRDYVHLIKKIGADGFLIGNNKGHDNGWVGYSKIFGKCIKVED